MVEGINCNAIFYRNAIAFVQSGLVNTEFFLLNKTHQNKSERVVLSYFLVLHWLDSRTPLGGALTTILQRPCNQYDTVSKFPNLALVKNLP